MADEIESNRDSVSSTASGVADLNLNQPTTTANKAGENKDKAKSKKGEALNGEKRERDKGDNFD